MAQTASIQFVGDDDGDGDALDRHNVEDNKIEFTLPRDVSAGYINNQREYYSFPFTKIFGMETMQDEVFEKAAKPVVLRYALVITTNHHLSAIEGYNGTVFAYGQTGSGKTYTMTGGTEKYADRGIIPRALQLLFRTTSQDVHHTYNVHCSFMEIYNEKIYDLLDPQHESRPLDQLESVKMRTDEDGSIIFHGLSSTPVSNEEEALNLLFVGETNRMIAETPMNLASSRSHAVLTVTIVSSTPGSDTVRKSQLHFVDLAGSERVSKTNAEGVLLKEAKYINLSLHYLEQVIVALQQRSNGDNQDMFIPYRNSLMTMVLKDSLGGNSKTVMIANVSVLSSHIDETICTCRFAVRVSTIKNVVEINESLDPSIVINKLRREVKELKGELAFIRGTEEDAALEVTESEKERLRNKLSLYLSDDKTVDIDELMKCVNSNKIVHEGFVIVKDLYVNAVSEVKSNVPNKIDNAAVKKALAEQEETISRQENEIALLLDRLQQRNSHRADAWCQTTTTTPMSPKPKVRTPSTTSEWAADKSAMLDRYMNMPDVPGKSALESNTSEYKSKHAMATVIQQKCEQSRKTIESLRALTEQIRIDKALESVRRADGADDADSRISKLNLEEDRVCKQLSKAIESYNASTSELKSAKSELSQIQLMITKSRETFTKGFERWYTTSLMERFGMSVSTDQVQSDTRPTPEPMAQKRSVSTSDVVELSNSKNVLEDKSVLDSNRITPLPVSDKLPPKPSETSAPVQPLSAPDAARPPSRSRSRPASEPTFINSTTPTGRRPSVDDDIAAFYKARDELMKKR